MRKDLQRAFALVMVCSLCSGLVPVSATASVRTHPVVPASAQSLIVTGESTADADPTSTPAPRRLEDDLSAVRFTGTWKYANQASASGNSARYSKTVYSAVSMSFDGTGVAVVGQLGPNRGRARVYLDGVSTATVSFYAPVHQSQQAVFRASGLGAGRHTLKLVVLGSKETSSTDTYVHVDAFDIDGVSARTGKVPGISVQEADSRLYRKGTWSMLRNSSAYGGGLARTGARGAAVTLRFKGTDVIWYGRKGPSNGLSEVWLDGKKVAMVSQYATATVNQRVVWAATGLKNTTHDVIIKSLGQASVPSGGTRTDLDVFRVTGSVLTALRPAPFSYPWKTYIVIDKSSFKLYWVRNKMLVKTYPIAHGKNNCTPERVWRIDAKYHTSPGSVYGPRKMRMFKRVATSGGYRYVFSAYAIHGTNQEWVIGTQASHGCIRMYNRDVLELFPQVPTGTMVVTRK